MAQELAGECERKNEVSSIARFPRTDPDMDCGPYSSNFAVKSGSRAVPVLLQSASDW
jgi:hypothetical protein